MEYVSKPAPKYRETDDGTFEEVIAEKANIKRPQAIFRVEWEPEAYGNAPPRHVTWEELENDEETWNNILDEKFHTETVRHELSNLTHGTDLLYVGLEGWVRFFRLEEEAEGLAYDAYFRNEGQYLLLLSTEFVANKTTTKKCKSVRCRKTKQSTAYVII